MIERDLEGWTIAFDLDGTLVETHEDLVGTLNRMLVLEGPAARADGERARPDRRRGAGPAGPRLRTGRARSAERAGDPDLFDAFIADYIDHIADHSRPFEGVVETLETLAARGATLVVVTNKRDGPVGTAAGQDRSDPAFRRHRRPGPGQRAESPPAPI